VLVAVRERLVASGVNAEVTGRPKHLWSIYEKMVVRGKEFDELYDLVGIRVIVESEKDCWAALGSIHAIWPPVQGRFKDYINSPKFNLYQSLHTTVIGLDGKPIEVQVRTHEMHRRPSTGSPPTGATRRGPPRRRGVGRPGRGGGGRRCRHQVEAGQGQGQGRQAGAADDAGPACRAGRAGPAGRTAGPGQGDVVDHRRGGVDAAHRRLPERDHRPHRVPRGLKLDLEEDEVYVFTPKGRSSPWPPTPPRSTSPTASTPRSAHKCIGAKVNGRLVPLDTRLNSADTVEIFTSKSETAGPSRDWLHMVASSRARSKIRQWFSRERREDAIELGRDELIKELRRGGLPVQKLASEHTLADWPRP